MELRSVRRARSSSRIGFTLAFIFASMRSPKATMRVACELLTADLTEAVISVRRAADCSAVKPAIGAWSEPKAIVRGMESEKTTGGRLEPPTGSVASAAVMLETA